MCESGVGGLSIRWRYEVGRSVGLLPALPDTKVVQKSGGGGGGLGVLRRGSCIKVSCVLPPLCGGWRTAGLPGY